MAFTTFQPPQSSLQDSMRRLGYTYSPQYGFTAAGYQPGPGRTYGNTTIPSSPGPFNPTAGAPDVRGNNPSRGFGGSGGGSNWINIALQAAGILGPFLTNRARGQAEGQLTEAQLAAQRNAAFNQNQLSQAQMDLLRRQFALNAPRRQAEDTARGDLLANVQDVNIQASPWVQSRIPRISGGIRPSALGPNARAAGRSLSDQSLSALQRGTTFDPVQFRDNAVPDIGTGTSNLGAILALASQLGELYRNSRQQAGG